MNETFSFWKILPKYILNYDHSLSAFQTISDNKLAVADYFCVTLNLFRALYC